MTLEVDRATAADIDRPRNCPIADIVDGTDPAGPVLEPPADEPVGASVHAVSAATSATPRTPNNFSGCDWRVGSFRGTEAKHRLARTQTRPSPLGRRTTD